MGIRTKRIYDAVDSADGTRILVDRVWPRGIRKPDARIDRWCRGVAPSPELRKWFGHDPARFDAFARAYREELAEREEALEELLRAARDGEVTLVFAARDREHNHAEVLAAYLRERLQGEAGD